MKRLFILILAGVMLSVGAAQAETTMSTPMTQELRAWANFEYKQWFNIDVPETEDFKAIERSAGEPENAFDVYVMEYTAGTAKINLVLTTRADVKILNARVRQEGENEGALTEGLSEWELWQRYSKMENELMSRIELPENTRIAFSSGLFVSPQFYIDPEDLANSDSAFSAIYLFKGPEGSRYDDRAVTLTWGPREDMLVMVSIENAE